MKTLFPVLGLCALLACNTARKQVNRDSLSAGDTAVPEAEAAIPALPLRDSLQIPDYNDTSFAVNIINISTYHDGEVPVNTSSMEWIGIYQRGATYYAAKSALHTKRVQDAVLDEEGDKPTAWEVSVDNPDTSLILVTTNSGIKEGPVDVVSDEPVAIGAGASYELDYKGVHYKLYAEGLPHDMEGEYVNYKLYLRTTINGKAVTQLLGATPSFDDVEGMHLLMAADLDGDGILDFLLDTSYHYNMTAPALYLSKPAEPGKILKLVALSNAVGC